MQKEGAYYHVYNRGCNKEAIFWDADDYQKLWEIIQNSKHEDYIELYAFSFMPNHFHLFLKQISEKPVYRWIQFVFNAYVQYFNKRYERSGTLFEARAKSREICEEEYLIRVLHYIHSNPQTDLQKQYSSLSMLHDETIVNREFYLDRFGSIVAYEEALAEYVQTKEDAELFE